jgi:hypothetical protein
VRILLFAIFGLVMLAAVACGDDDGGSAPTPTPTTPPGETSTPTPPPDVSGPTGIPEVDAAIKAVLNGDAEALDGMVALQETECIATQEGLGGPPRCTEGEVAGTVVQVFPVAYCEGTFSRDPGPVLADFVSKAKSLHSVVEAPDEPRVEPYWPVGDTYVNFVSAFDGNEAGTRLVFEGGKVVMAFFGCLHNPDDLMQHRGEPLEVIYRASE